MPNLKVLQCYPYPILYGRFASEAERPALDQIMRSGLASPVCHCLLLDNRDRRAFISQRNQTMILFALMEPEEGDAYTVFVDGLLLNSGSESYRQPVPVEFVDELRRLLDGQTATPNVRDRLPVEPIVGFAVPDTLLRSGWGMTRHPWEGAVQQLGLL